MRQNAPLLFLVFKDYDRPPAVRRTSPLEKPPEEAGGRDAAGIYVFVVSNLSCNSLYLKYQRSYTCFDVFPPIQRRPMADNGAV